MKRGIITIPEQYPEDHTKVNKIWFSQEHPPKEFYYPAQDQTVSYPDYHINDIVFYSNGISILKNRQLRSQEMAGAETEQYEDLTWVDLETLPIASAEKLGGIKIGNGLTIQDGILSANPGGYDEKPVTDRLDQLELGNFSNSNQRLSDINFSFEDKAKLDGIDNGANKYSLPIATQEQLGGIILNDKIVLDSTGRVTKLGYEDTLLKLTDNNKINKVSIVAQLPETREENTLYFVEEGV